MKITGASVFGTDGQFHEGEDILIRDGFFAEPDEVAEPDEAVIEADGCYAIPGLLDIHFHGAMGQDVCDATMEAWEAIAAYEASVGVTAICPATLTLPVEELEEVLRTGARYAAEHTQCEDRPVSADLVGFNMEGPFISRVKKGAQNEKYIIPCNAEIVDRFLAASDGLVKIIGLAPEDNPNYEAYIRAVKDRVTVSLAHTNAGYEEAMGAFRAGASHAVHLYNAMTGLTHRAPGVVGAVSDANAPSFAAQYGHGVNAEIICDGIHIEGAAVRAAFRMNGAEHMVLISDSLRSTGMSDGEYLLGGQMTIKRGRYCKLKEGGNLAGSVTNLTDCMRYAIRQMQIPMEEIVAAATIQPARAIGVDGLYGSIAPGKKGDVVLLKKDDALTLAGVIKDGQLITGELLNDRK